MGADFLAIAQAASQYFGVPLEDVFGLGLVGSLSGDIYFYISYGTLPSGEETYVKWLDFCQDGCDCVVDVVYLGYDDGFGSLGPVHDLIWRKDSDPKYSKLFVPGTLKLAGPVSTLEIANANTGLWFCDYDPTPTPASTPGRVAVLGINNELADSLWRVRLIAR